VVQVGEYPARPPDRADVGGPVASSGSFPDGIVDCPSTAPRPAVFGEVVYVADHRIASETVRTKPELFDEAAKRCHRF
jgi:hypothetical protein